MKRNTSCLAIFAAALACATQVHAVTVFNFDLDPFQEVPPNESNAAGAASLTYDPLTKTYDLDLFVVGIPLDMLAGAGPNQTPVHIHRAAAGVNGPIVVDVGFVGTFFEDDDGIRLQINDAPFGGVQGGVNSDPQQNEDALFAGNMYLNVHTHEFMGGQIRGQIVPEPVSLALLAIGACACAWRRSQRAEKPD